MHFWSHHHHSFNMLEPLLRPLGLAPPALSTGKFALPRSSPGVPMIDYPLGILDTMAANSAHMPVVLMRFNDILSPEKLHVSLERLLQIGDWRKLAGRAVRDTQGKVVLRVPERHWEVDGYEAVDFSVVEYHVEIQDHPLGAQLPNIPCSLPGEQEAEVLRLQPGVATFRTFCAPKDRASGLETLILTQQPVVSLRVTSFTNATLVAVSWSHAVMDGLAFKAMLNAWCFVLAGKESDVRDVDSAFQDVAVRLWDEELRKKECGEEAQQIQEEVYMWADKILTGWGFFLFALGFIWTVFIRQTQVGNRTLVLPAGVMESLRKEAEKGRPSDEFVSDGDIMSAWFTKLLVEAHEWTGPVTQMNVVDMRSRVPGVFDSNGVYLQNLANAALTFFENEEVSSTRTAAKGQDGKGLGGIAAKIRGSVAQQITPSQVLALWKRSWPTIRDNGRPPVFGDASSKLAIVSNWAKAKFILDTDFSPAVVSARKAERERQNLSGRMVYEITGQIVQEPIIRDTAVIIGKDCEGNYWLALYLAEHMFERMDQLIKRTASQMVL